MIYKGKPRSVTPKPLRSHNDRNLLDAVHVVRQFGGRPYAGLAGAKKRESRMAFELRFAAHCRRRNKPVYPCWFFKANRNKPVKKWSQYL